MENILITLNKIIFLLILIFAGVLAKRFKLLSDAGEKDLSKLLVDLFWPALVFVSIAGSLNQKDIISNIHLPLFAFITCALGFLAGFIAIKILHYKDGHKKIFLYDCIMNNFIYLVLPFATVMIPGKGAGLLFIHNLGMIFILWTFGIFILKGNIKLKEIPKRLLSTGLIATILAILTVLLKINAHIPKLIFNVLDVMGKPTVPVAMIIAGASIYKLGKNALKFNTWNISLGLLRLIIIPGLLFILTYFLKVYFNLPRETIIIFMLVNIMPVSINSISLAIRFKSSPDLAAQAVVFTHLFALLTIPIYIIMIEKWLI